MIKNEILICDCNTPEHQLIFSYFDDSEIGYNEVCLYVHLNKRPFLKRIIHGIKYIFGYKSQYGEFDVFIFNPDDIEKLENVIKYLKKINDKSTC